MAINGQSCARRRPGYRGTCRVFATSKGARLVGGKRARPSQHSDRAGKMARMNMAHLRILLEGSRPLKDSVDEVIRSHKMFYFYFRLSKDIAVCTRSQFQRECLSDVRVFAVMSRHIQKQVFVGRELGVLRKSSYRGCYLCCENGRMTETRNDWKLIRCMIKQSMAMLLIHSTLTKKGFVFVFYLKAS